VRQLEEKNVKEEQKLRGRKAAARLVNSVDCPDLFAFSPLKNKFLITYNILYRLIDFFLVLFQ
jgi:hypothetical protein